ncbi:hypothetical protein LCGC14_2356250 [marine sediment metagenome]|uniref:Uncharacterized protein n=1 Tax=marine sediment metagenome TaxID=412755 RepID=A0A0F9F2S3_9ZZZZ
MKFIMTLGCLPSNRLWDEQQQGLIWKYVIPGKIKDPILDATDVAEQNRVQQLHFPTVELSPKTKDEFIKEVTRIASNLYDSAESIGL